MKNNYFNKQSSALRPFNSITISALWRDQRARRIYILITIFYYVASLSGVVLCFSVEDIRINSICFSVVPMSSSKRLSRAERQQIKLPENLKEILVGLLLGDLYGCKQAVNVHLQFVQGIIHKDYFYYLTSSALRPFNSITITALWREQRARRTDIMPSMLLYKIGL
jgi:hypothetical protein